MVSVRIIKIGLFARRQEFAHLLICKFAHSLDGLLNLIIIPFWSISGYQFSDKACEE